MNPAAAPGGADTRPALPGHSRGYRMVKIYSTDTKAPRPLGHSGRHMKVRLNDDVIIWRIANEIYKDPLSGVRELMANGITAIENAISAGLLGRADARLSVHVTAEKQLVISDNGTGITLEVLDKVLRVMGNSGNFDGTRTGRFGMGFFAFTTASSSIIINTSCGDGAGFGAVCTDGRAFDVFKRTTRKERGTTLTLQLYDGEEGPSGKKMPVISVPEVLDMAREIAMMAKIPVTITSEYRENAWWLASRRADFDGTTFEENLPRGGDGRKRPMVARDGEIEFALMFTADTAKTYLAGMPIRAFPRDENGPGLPHGTIVNMLDERVYSPMPDREHLTADACSRLERRVHGMLRREIDRLWGITDHASFVASDRKAEFEWVLDNIQLIHDLGLNEGSRLWKTRHELYAPIFKGEGGQFRTLWDIMTDKDAAVCTKFKRDVKRALKRTGKEVERYIPAAGFNEEQADIDHMALAKKWGVPDVDGLLRKKKVSVTAGDRTGVKLDAVKAHMCEDGYKSMPLSMVPDGTRVVMARKGGFNGIYRIIRVHSFPGTAFIKHSPEIDGPGIIPYDRWIKDVLSAAYRTNKGPVRLSDLLRPEKAYATDKWLDKRAAELLAESGMTVFTDRQNSLALALGALETGRQVTHISDDDIIEDVTGYRVPPKYIDLARSLPSDAPGHAREAVSRFISTREIYDDGAQTGRIASYLARAGVPATGGKVDRAVSLWEAVRESGLDKSDAEEILDQPKALLGFDPVKLNGFKRRILDRHLSRMLTAHKIRRTDTPWVFRFTGTLRDGEAALGDVMLNTGNWMRFTRCTVRAAGGGAEIRGQVVT